MNLSCVVSIFQHQQGERSGRRLGPKMTVAPKKDPQKWTPIKIASTKMKMTVSSSEFIGTRLYMVVMNFGQRLAKLDETSPAICLEKTHRMAEKYRKMASNDFGQWDLWLPADVWWKFMGLHPFLADSPKDHQIYDSSCRSGSETPREFHGFPRDLPNMADFWARAEAWWSPWTSCGILWAYPWPEAMALTVRWVAENRVPNLALIPPFPETHWRSLVSEKQSIVSEQSNQFSLPLKCIN